MMMMFETTKSITAEQQARLNVVEANIRALANEGAVKISAFDEEEPIRLVRTEAARRVYEERRERETREGSS